MFKHILIPTDGSEVAAKAIAAGVTLAKEMGASLTAYYAIEPAPTHIYGEGYLADRRLVAELERRTKEIAKKAVDQIGDAARSAGVPCESVVEQCLHPYQGIIEAAKKNKCDAIFMASHGHSGLTGLVLGSVTHKVLTNSKIPVLVYR
jgi:nucleotide-binding universal stress UspA family protein